MGFLKTVGAVLGTLLVLALLGGAVLYALSTINFGV
jgi:hypothetical protein